MSTVSVALILFWLIWSDSYTVPLHSGQLGFIVSRDQTASRAGSASWFICSVSHFPIEFSRSAACPIWWTGFFGNLHKFPLRTITVESASSKVKMPFELPFCVCFKIIQCIVLIRLAMRRALLSLNSSNEGLLHSYLFLWLEIWFKGIAVHCVWFVSDFEFNLTTLKRFNAVTWPQERVQQW